MSALETEPEGRLAIGILQLRSARLQMAFAPSSWPERLYAAEANAGRRVADKTGARQRRNDLSCEVLQLCKSIKGNIIIELNRWAFLNIYDTVDMRKE